MLFNEKFKNSRVENLPAALIFIKMIYKISASGHTAVSAYKPSNLLINLIVFNGVPGIAVDSAAIILSMYRLFTFFVKFGEFSCKFYTIAERSLYYDAAALNYMCLSKFNSANILSDQFINYSSKNLTTLKKAIVSNSVDAVFIVDYNTKYKVIKKIATGPYFLFGLCSSREKSFLYDIYLPINGTSLDAQYLFIELALYGVCLGMSNNYKQTIKTYKKTLETIKLL